MTNKAIFSVLRAVLLLSAGIAWLTGCLDKRISETQNTPLRFSVKAGRNTVSNSPTRATPIESDEDFYNEFGAFAFIYPSSDSWSSSGTTLKPDYMYNTRVTRSSGWTTSCFWPGSAYKVKFFAYAPYNGTGISLSSASSLGAPSMTYEVPSSVSAQKDILAASPAEASGDTNAAESLTFYHALTAVKFTSDEMLPGTISQISINGVYTKGTHTLGSSSWTPETSLTGDFSQTLSVAVDGSEGQTVTQPAQTFIMLPQTLPSGASITVSYKDNLTGTERTLTADIGGSTWPFGKTIVYKISTSGISVTSTFEVTAPQNFTYSGGTNSYTVTSYATVAQSGGSSATLPVAWTAQFSTDNGATWSSTAPSWLTAFTTSGEGGASAESYNASVEAQTANDHTSYLRQAAAVSNYDLSTNGGTTSINTANCYIVGAAGSYKLPLVYGNGIKNGSINTSAYTTTTTESSVLSTLVNHLGNAITSPYIYQNTGCTPASAKLVWQDSQNLITNVSLDGTSTYLTFEVSSENIVPGNAVVAVCDGNGDIMWSWHIWFTDYNLGDDLKTVGSYSFLPYNIGWVDDATVYEERSVKVRFTQTGTGEEKTIEIKQDASYTNAYYFRNLYFQWGRKDPMMSGYVYSSYDDFTRQNITLNTVRTWYDENGTSYSTWNYSDFGSGTSEIVSCIKNPHYFDKNDDDMFANYNNMWAANNSSTEKTVTATVKTIYDPSPIGYKVPTVSALETISSNRSWDGNRKGYIFTCTNGETSLFAAFGQTYINNNGEYIIRSGSDLPSPYGYYWTSLPSDSAEAWNMIFSSSYTPNCNHNPKIYGKSVRPVKE